MNIAQFTVSIEMRSTSIDGFQMSIKHLTSGGQACDQEAAVNGEPFTLREHVVSFIFQH